MICAATHHFSFPKFFTSPTARLLVFPASSSSLSPAHDRNGFLSAVSPAAGVLLCTATTAPSSPFGGSL
jgi:hypothetical protein